jgi:hypothetical protein
MTALVVVLLIVAFFAAVTWLADRTQPPEPEPFEQSSHVTVLDEVAK